jgi:GNAT superfamily N-acetyltransferase
MMRATRSFQGSIGDSATSGRPAVWVDDLQNYDINQSKKRRKDLAYARRSNSLITITDKPVDATQCYELYASTILAQGGKLRYTSSYFRKLHEISEKTSNIKIFSAVNKDKIVSGFVVLVLNGNESYYLHGAVDLDGRRHGLSDLLLEQLVQAAQENGALRLDFMASPWEQRGLIKFKEKWGTKTGLVVTCDVSGSIFGESIVAYSKFRSRSDLHHALDWRSKNS